jgi:hypothetical protein
MPDKNRFGLTRDIGAATKRIIRQQSKFGCVLCRRGVYTYEHIEPTFAEATSHNPDRICCLCSGCHDLVTRGQYSKAFVAQAYARVKQSTAEEVGPPVGPLDFHTGTAVLEIGDLRYAPAVRSVFVYEGVELFGVHPSSDPAQSGSISAVFTNDSGEVVASITENGWEGSVDVWDIEVVAERITVRRKSGEICLQILLRPPGVVVVDRLDMRFGDAHLLVGSGTYAVGRYLSESDVCWVHAQLAIHASSPNGRVIEFTRPDELVRRLELFRNLGTCLEEAMGVFAIDANAGVMVKPLGIAIGGLTGSFSVTSFASGIRPIDEIRRVITSHPADLSRFIGTGSQSTLRS